MTFKTLISVSALSLGAAFLALPSHGFAANTGAAQTVTKACSAKYEAAKKANTLHGQTWPQFLHSCSVSMKGTNTAPSKAPAPSKSPSSAPAPAAPQSTEKQAMATGYPEARFQYAAETNTATPGGAPMKHPREMGFRQRVHECKAEWKADKAAGKVQSGQGWRDYWKACDVRLKTQKTQ
ncbi:hypothetical protein M2281_003096 [Mesorhizobium soli]|jgi:hypothetical protein|uniref:hypothetical protein n=1 Tax=Pseudaminobacter soli (ex Li et al. 2025) TaxID=1295366 RepID=UPI00247598B6|nr:hypothetical protein [Mesorhizobium soli]MDH6232497.1 hypothetical protein [Mesorhizobium soli]